MILSAGRGRQVIVVIIPHVCDQRVGRHPHGPLPSQQLTAAISSELMKSVNRPVRPWPVIPSVGAGHLGSGVACGARSERQRAMRGSGAVRGYGAGLPRCGGGREANRAVIAALETVSRDAPPDYCSVKLCDGLSVTSLHPGGWSGNDCLVDSADSCSSGVAQSLASVLIL